MSLTSDVYAVISTTVWSKFSKYGPKSPPRQVSATTDWTPETVVRLKAVRSFGNRAFDEFASHEPSSGLASCAGSLKSPPDVLRL